MPKKVKSFAVDEKIYETLFGMFKENYVDISLSYCLNKYIKEFLGYLQAVQEELGRNESCTVPMPFIIETAARQPVFRAFNPGELTAEVAEFQRRYDAHCKKAPMPVPVEEGTLVEMDSMSGIAKLVKVIAKTAVKELMEGRDLTDDEYIQMVRDEGGKPFHRFIREKVLHKDKAIGPKKRGPK